MIQEFQFKTYRVEWQIQLNEVDQYGMTRRTYETHPYPTREMALAHLPEFAEESKWVKDRWIPKNAPHDYCEAQISYQEVLQK